MKLGEGRKEGTGRLCQAQLFGVTQETAWRARRLCVRAVCSCAGMHLCGDLPVGFAADFANVSNAE
jgi:hypothetical protein